MLRLFGPECDAKPIDAGTCKALPETAVWVDLLDPTEEEEALAEKLVGAIPTRDELAEIEPSSRLYERKGTLFMSVPVLFGLRAGAPRVDPIGFVLTAKHLVTIRYIDPKPFQTFADIAYADPEEVEEARQALLGLLDAMVGRVADEFEAAGKEIEQISKRIFNRHAHRNERNGELQMEAIMMRIGHAQALLSRLRETSVGTTRMLSFFLNAPMIENENGVRRHVKSLLADTQALNDHASFLSDNLTFLLDASLGLIGLDQNQVMKTFSVVAVVLMPPTLIAGIYGMNFKFMPELEWAHGYPMALVAIAASMVLPYVWAKRKGWL